MSPLASFLLILLLGAAFAIVSAPLTSARRRRVRRTEGLAQLEAAREAKYQEIRDAELDFKLGKHSQQDYEAVDATLRAEALEILDRIETLEASAQPQLEQH
jgi:hypothetical protein